MRWAALPAGRRRAAAAPRRRAGRGQDGRARRGTRQARRAPPRGTAEPLSSLESTGGSVPLSAPVVLWVFGMVLSFTAGSFITPQGFISLRAGVLCFVFGIWHSLERSNDDSARYIKVYLGARRRDSAAAACSPGRQSGECASPHECGRATAVRNSTSPESYFLLSLFVPL